jgi:ERCC4-type nuclease
MTDRSFILVADSRESSVIPYLSEFDINFVSKQITIGDYAIMKNNKILGCFERKTFDDLAASFKDGRYENIDKMRLLRNQTGCDLYIILEGPQFPANTTKFQGIPYTSIMAAITNLMVRDKIQIIYSKDQQYTANRLSDILHAYAKFNIETTSPVEMLKAKISELQEIVAHMAEPEKAEVVVVAGSDTSQLTQRIHVSESSIASNMWETLPNISNVTAKIISTKMSLFQLANGDISQIDELKTAQGRKISSQAKTTLLSISAGNAEAVKKMLSAIPSISAATVNLLLEHYDGDVKKIINASIEEMGEIKIQQSSRTVRFGTAKAEKIYNMIRFIAPT